MNPALAAVTLEQLLSHTSGIPTDNEEIAKIYFNVDAFDFNTYDLRIKALEAWKANKPEAPAGAPFQYSNFGYVIAGAMIERRPVSRGARVEADRPARAGEQPGVGGGVPGAFGAGHRMAADEAAAVDLAEGLSTGSLTEPTSVTVASASIVRSSSAVARAGSGTARTTTPEAPG